MEAACWAALCGRALPDVKDSVAQSAVLLYHRFAYNCVEREADLTKRRFRELWRKLGYEAAVQRITGVIDRVLRPEQGRIDESEWNGTRAALAGWPPEWKRPEGFKRAFDRLTRTRQSIAPDRRSTQTAL